MEPAHKNPDIRIWREKVEIRICQSGTDMQTLIKTMFIQTMRAK